VGAAVVVPAGLLARLRGDPPVEEADGPDRATVERLAMEAVMAHQRRRGHEVIDVSARRCGWDVTSLAPDGREWHIEVKGRHAGASTVTVTKNEILYALNQADKFVLAIVRVDGTTIDGPHFIPRPFSQAPDHAEACRTFQIDGLLRLATRHEVLTP
jgi:hypothetical protein